MAKGEIDLAEAVGGILADYAQVIGEALRESMREEAKKGIAKLKKTSPRSSGPASMGKKHYADQWAAREELTRVTAKVTVYNKAPTYRLAHLLENGHAKRGGGRTPGNPHIKPVEDKMIKDFTEAVREAAQG